MTGLNNISKKDTTYTSIWYFLRKKKLGQYEDDISNKDIRKFGNKFAYSEFNSTFAEKIIKFYSEKGDKILDPFAGRTRCIISMLSNRQYYGFEVSPIVYNHIVEKLKYKTLIPIKYPPVVFNDDSFNIDSKDIPQVDLIFTCPPYWNKEEYESVDGQLSDINYYNTFLERLKLIFEKSKKYLVPGGFCIVIVSDIRKDNKLIPFHSDMMGILQDIGLKFYDIIILQTVSLDVASIRFGGFKHKKLLSKVHEYCLIYKK